MRSAISTYKKEVESGQFPLKEHYTSIDKSVIKNIVKIVKTIVELNQLRDSLLAQLDLFQQWVHYMMGIYH